MAAGRQLLAVLSMFAEILMLLPYFVILMIMHWELWYLLMLTRVMT